MQVSILAIIVPAIWYTYQHISQQDWHDYNESNPKGGRDLWKGDFRLIVTISIGSLPKDVIKVKLPCGHGHQLLQGPGRSGEWGTLEIKKNFIKIS